MLSENPVSAVLFDLDGVLADSEQWWSQIDTALLLEHGAEYRGEYKQAILGRSFPLAMEFYKNACQIQADTNAMVQRRQEIAAEFFATKIALFPASLTVLQTLLRMNLRIALATSSVGKCVRPLFLDRTGLGPLLHAVVTGDEVERGKPNPDIYLLAARRLHVPPANCLVVEDALSGIEAATAAGMRVAAIPDARFVDLRAYEGKADYLLARLEELPALAHSLMQT